MPCVPNGRLADPLKVVVVQRRLNVGLSLFQSKRILDGEFF